MELKFSRAINELIGFIFTNLCNLSRLFLSTNFFPDKTFRIGYILDSNEFIIWFILIRKIVKEGSRIRSKWPNADN